MLAERGLTTWRAPPSSGERNDGYPALVALIRKHSLHDELAHWSECWEFKERVKLPAPPADMEDDDDADEAP